MTENVVFGFIGLVLMAGGVVWVIRAVSAEGFVGVVFRVVLGVFAVLYGFALWQDYGSALILVLR